MPNSIQQNILDIGKRKGIILYILNVIRQNETEEQSLICAKGMQLFFKASLNTTLKHVGPVTKEIVNRRSS